MNTNLPNISTKYLGLSLKSPIIASSSDFTASIDNIIKLEQAGVGAIVLKSIFEEQILMEIDSLRTNNMFNTFDYNENYIAYYTKKHETDSYLELISQAKKQTSIPIIASIHCSSDDEWVSYAKSIENSGADALELNIFILPSKSDQTVADIENIYFNTVKSVRKQTSLPIAVKLHHYFTDLSNFMVKLSKEVDALVLFNRFFNPDINIESLKIESADIFSNSSDLYLVQRWIGLLKGNVDSDLSASGGIHDANGVIKCLLAGADVVQIASTFYSNGIEVVEDMNNGLKSWMKRKDFNSLDDFKGSISYKNIKNPSLYERAQFMKYFGDR